MINAKHSAAQAAQIIFFDPKQAERVCTDALTLFMLQADDFSHENYIVKKEIVNCMTLTSSLSNSF